MSLSLSHWYPGSGVVLDCIDSDSFHPKLLLECFSTMVLDNFPMHQDLAVPNRAGALLAKVIRPCACTLARAWYVKQFNWVHSELQK